jgi:hypothetical protein
VNSTTSAPRNFDSTQRFLDTTRNFVRDNNYTLKDVTDFFGETFDKDDLKNIKETFGYTVDDDVDIAAVNDYYQTLRP